MATPNNSSSGGILGGLCSGLLMLLVLVLGLAGYYALQPPGLPLELLRRDLARLSSSAPEPTVCWVKTTVARRSARVLAPLVPRSDREATQVWFDQLVALVPLVTLRGLLLLWALPLLLPSLAWALMEGLWTRERIALSTGYSSAAGFGLGKGLGLAAIFLAICYLVAPWSVAPGECIATVLALAATGTYLLGRNLPLHF